MSSFIVRFNGVKVARKEDELSVRLKINDLLKRSDFKSIEILNGEENGSSDVEPLEAV